MSIRVSPTYGGNINIWVNGSKGMDDNQLEALAMPGKVHLTITDPATGGVLVDVDLPMSAFSTGSVGYKFQLNQAMFQAKA